MDGLCPLQEKVIAYAREHEAEIRAIAIAETEQYLESAPFEELLVKFLTGCREHGPMPEGVDWCKEAKNEYRDAFWYTAMSQYQASVHPVLSETN